MVVILLLLLFLGILLSLPAVQTKIGQYLTNSINEDFGTDINVEQVTFNIFGGVKLKEVLIRDHHKDTLIFANRIKTNILDFNRLLDGDLLFGNVNVSSLFFNLKQYKGEKFTNLDKFIEAFDDGSPSSGKFLMTAESMQLTESRFLMEDQNQKNAKVVDFLHINATLNDFKIKGSDVFTTIYKMNFKDFRGLQIQNVKTQFTYTKDNILLEKLEAKTKKSIINGNVALRYKREDFSDFNNKVVFDAKIDSASVASNDIRYFYDELGKDNQFVFKTNLLGTLNDFTTQNLFLEDVNGTQIIGEINFKNILSKEKSSFYMKGDFEKMTSNYDDLASILPNILGKSLPTSLKKLGQFNIEGKTELTLQTIKTDLIMNSALGNLQTNLIMNNLQNIDNASYEGVVVLDNFNVGALINQKDIGLVSMNVEVNGKGFTEKLIDTKIKGKVSRIQYNKYNYQGIIVDGSLKNPIFKGKVNINDPNLFMDFDGIVDVSKRENVYKFDALVDYANLSKLNFVKNDSVSIFKGKIYSNLTGNSLDNLHGDVLVEQASYQNNRDIYVFDSFSINSSFDENRERTIAINSPDIIEGKLVGKFDFNQLPFMLENSLGSIYANYNPNKIKKGQYLRFNFSIFNKIIEIFYPEITVSTNTFIRGSINSDNNDFKLDFDSPEIIAFDNKFEKVDIQVDNKNPLFNTYVSIDSVKTKYYKISDFNLINVTKRDTLFFRTEFKGGNKADDYYNIDAYHTIDEEKNSVVGIFKSELNFKDYLWYINKENNNENRIVFDKKFSNFVFENFSVTHDEQKINFLGTIKGKDYKDLKLNFNQVNIGKIIPEIENFVMEGNMNGEINFKQNDQLYEPFASIKVDDLKVNNIDFGILNLDVKGNEDLKTFAVNGIIKNDNLESFITEGNISFEGEKPFMNLDLRLNNFNIGAFSTMGGDVISNIRGLVTGNANFRGTISNPEINGRLFLNDAGLTVPYLNVDYKLEKNAVVDLTERQFLLRNIELTDSKYNTSGILNGNVRHTNLSDWKLDLKIDTDNLIALDTQDSDEAYYYGKAFIAGNATISGPTNALLISVNATSKKGTAIKIPISNVQSVGEKSYIRFITPEEKYNYNTNLKSPTRNYNGLELDFDLTLTEDAEIEVILDKETGHNMKGRGVGIITMQINTFGKFNIFGDYQVYEGIYNFKYRGLVSKRFDVKKYGSIIWEGDPLRARLNLEAIYKTRANPGMLLNNTTVNQKVPVEVGIAINGTISNPEPDFNINFPTISSVLKSEIQTKLDDRDTRQTQALYLLASGSFLSPEGALGQNALYNNLFETVSGVFDNIFNDEDSKISMGVNYVAPDTTPGREADGNVGVTTSFNLNERISVNGNLGVPVGGINDAAVVGDVEILYRVNEDGTLNMRVFNRESDINYVGEGIGYTQGIGVSYQVDFDTFNELITKVFKNAKLTEDKSTNDDIPDSDYAPEFIKFTERKKAKTEKKVQTPPETENIPEQ
ncbi:translocation/assembly module TamB [Flavobacterium azooxidireducens]|uniref:Translocation/assembly module TamB n=1 Tax=Flavobacterium azooxidireducens TaxID=1871076 RepID=A0ABY4KJ65_9FLAO|nr:translocation/assembly module TamB domain-containing protein [Flavobacterium azooxidireducens]UPQ80889.1 translocation/assembly module TamB [Flavobacterium azooxidireducens]